MFEGFAEETIRFFLDLRFHNENSFFRAHEDEYRAYVKEPFYAFIEALVPALQTIADDFEVRPNKCLARIHRDTRFSKDKSPYRDHMWFLLRKSGEPRETAVAYWFELSPEVLEWGVGFWGYNRPAMDAFRKRMVNKPREVLKVLKKCGIPEDTLMIYGDRYKRLSPPANLPKELEMLYSCKEIYVKRIGTPISACYSSDIVKLVANDLIRLKPLYELLRSLANEGMAQLDA